MKNNFLFIVGVGRSGTSLLQCMLNSHKDIAFLPETHFVRHYLHLEKNIAEIAKDVINDDDLRKSGLDLSKLVSNSSTVKELYEQILKSYGGERGKSLVGDKDPKNIEYLKTITHHFPESFVIHIYRDPRAVIASRKKAKWSSGRALWMHLLAYKTQINYGRKLGGLSINNYYEIKYEDLVHDPKAVLLGLLNTLGLEYDSNMETYYRASSEVISGEEIAWKNKCFEPVSNDGLERWRDELSANEIAVIEYILEPEMREFGYITNGTYTKSPSLLQWAYRSFIQLVSIIYCSRFK